MPELPPITVSTPAPETTFRPAVKRSWKARAVTLINAAVAFVLALAGYLQTVNLANFGITADRAMFWMAIIGLLQFLLMQWKPIKELDLRPDQGQG